MMMMNDFIPITPDPQMILLRDKNGVVVIRFKPCSIDDATRILHNKVFDLDGAHSRIEQRRAMELKEAFLAVKQKELDNEIQNAIDSVSKCDIHALEAKISSHLDGFTHNVFTDIDNHMTTNLLGASKHAMADVARAVERQLRAALDKSHHP